MVALNYGSGRDIYKILYIEGLGAGKHLLFARVFWDWKRDPAAEVCDSLEQSSEQMRFWNKMP